MWRTHRPFAAALVALSLACDTSNPFQPVEPPSLTGGEITVFIDGAVRHTFSGNMKFGAINRPNDHYALGAYETVVMGTGETVHLIRVTGYGGIDRIDVSLTSVAPFSDNMTLSCQEDTCRTWANAFLDVESHFSEVAQASLVRASQTRVEGSLTATMRVHASGGAVLRYEEVLVQFNVPVYPALDVQRMRNGLR